MPSCLILGDGNCLWADIQAALQLFTPDLIAACNNSGLHYEGHVDHWFTLHPMPCQDWPGIEEAIRRRTVVERRNKPTIWCYKSVKWADKVTPDWGGATGLLAIKGMIEFGCGPIVLAGVPMTKAHGHFYDKRTWDQAEKYTSAWKVHLNEIKPYVRSMSGFTKELLGAPTPEWIAQFEPAMPALASLDEGQ